MDEARRKAARKGERFYEPEWGCGACGSKARYVSTGKCVECTRARSRDRYDEGRRALKAARAEVSRGELAWQVPIEPS